MARFKLLPAQREGLYSTPSRVNPEAATQTFSEGALLINNAGNLQEAGVDPVDIIGVSAEAGHNAAAAAKSVRYHPALPHVVFEGSIDDSNAIGTGAIAATDLHAAYGLTLNTGVWYVDKFKTGAQARVVIVGFKDPLTTVNGRVYFIFKKLATIYL